MAEAGEITAITAVLKFGKNDHRAGLFGTYKTNPTEALQAVMLLKSKILGDLLPVFGRTY